VVLRDVCMSVGVGLLHAVDEFVPWGKSRSRDILDFGGKVALKKNVCRWEVGGRYLIIWWMSSGKPMSSRVSASSRTSCDFALVNVLRENIIPK
jgi:hypothetical protein